ncbi:hypothetical protein [Deinococcus sp.]|uniref:hypothetical protein n=1 Tax=Deinococcus sp. TaxID=47478 RepID=UPI003B5CF2E2
MGLNDDPFSVQHTKSGMLRISRGLQVVVTLGGKWAERLTTALDAAENEDARQQLLAPAPLATIGAAMSGRSSGVSLSF